MPQSNTKIESFTNSEEERIFWFSLLEDLISQSEPGTQEKEELPVILCWWIEEFVKRCPAYREQLLKIISTGRLSISEWFITPAFPEQLPEIIIRNLVFSVHFQRHFNLKLNSPAPLSVENLINRFQPESIKTSAGFFSARINLKKQTLHCVDLLTRYLEPLNCLALLNNAQSKKAHLNRAWALLLRNQTPAIQLGYCSDSLAEDSQHRHKQVLDICSAIEKRILSELFPAQSGESDNFIIFNPCFRERSDIVEYHFTGNTADNPLAKSFSVIDTDRNKPIRHQLIRQESPQDNAIAQKKTILLDLKEIPGLSFGQLKISAAIQAVKNEASVKSGRYFLENEYLHATVRENGSITLLDKKNNQLYERLNIFEDSRDIGDTSQFVPPESNEVILSKSFKPRISLVETGPLRGAIRMRYRMKIPNRSSETRNRKREKYEILRIRTLVSLDYNSPFLRITTRVNNTIQNHRLRVRFETGTLTRKSFTQKFGFITENQHTEDIHKNTSPDYEQSMHRFVTIKDKTRALTVFSKDTVAYQLNPDTKRTLALTLLRSVGKLHTGEPVFNMETTQSAQCPGEHVFEYGLFPHTPAEIDSFQSLNSQLENFHFPMSVFQAGPVTANNGFNNGISIEPGELSVLCFKEAEAGGHFILRILNPTGQRIRAKCNFSFPVKSVVLVSYDELTEEKTIKHKNGSAAFTVNPKEIITLKIMNTPTT